MRKLKEIRKGREFQSKKNLRDLEKRWKQNSSQPGGKGKKTAHNLAEDTTNLMCRHLSLGCCVYELKLHSFTND